MISCVVIKEDHFHVGSPVEGRIHFFPSSEVGNIQNYVFVKTIG